MEHQQLILYPGKEYSSFNAFLGDFKLYETQVKQDFIIGHSEAIDSEALVYKRVEYKCVYGPKRESKSTEKRQARFIFYYYIICNKTFMQELLYNALCIKMSYGSFGDIGRFSNIGSFGDIGSFLTKKNFCILFLSVMPYQK